VQTTSGNLMALESIQSTWWKSYNSILSGLEFCHHSWYRIHEVCILDQQADFSSNKSISTFTNVQHCSNLTQNQHPVYLIVMHELFLEILKRIGRTIYLPEPPTKIRPSLVQQRWNQFI